MTGGYKRHIHSETREILADLDTPLSSYGKLKNAYPSSPAFLLESVETREKLGRYSFIGIEPFLVFRSLGKRIMIEGELTEERDVEDPFEELRRVMGDFAGSLLPDGFSLSGGAVGYVGYDMVRFFERLPGRGEMGLPTWDMWFMFPRKLVVFDNYTRRMKLVVFEPYGEGAGREVRGATSREEAGAIAGRELAVLHAIIRTPFTITARGDFSVKMDGSTTSKQEFEEMVVRAKEYIYAGDIIQVVLSQRFGLETNADELSLYRALRVVNPSPYMFLLDCGPYSLIGSSPETLVRLEGSEVEVRPIAGTRRRGKDASEDESLAKELLADEKEVAEHVMLVDLGRNDVGRIACIGTVTVPEFMAIEKYSHVMHMSSTVKGIVKEGMDALDVFRSVFPAGTVAGAPKIRAMEIIDELETVKRGIYAGAVGYFAYNGNMDFCITIRTLLKIGDRVYVQAGAGIVADSIPEKEYMETIQKAKGVVKSITDIKEIID